MKMSVIILIFGLLVIVPYIFVMIKLGKGWGENSTKIVIITLVLVSSIFLITAGYDETQITPVIGLLGTIVGYALSKSSPVAAPKES